MQHSWLADVKCGWDVANMWKPRCVAVKCSQHYDLQKGCTEDCSIQQNGHPYSCSKLTQLYGQHRSRADSSTSYSSLNDRVGYNDAHIGHLMCRHMRIAPLGEFPRTMLPQPRPFILALTWRSIPVVVLILYLAGVIPVQSRHDYCIAEPPKNGKPIVVVSQYVNVKIKDSFISNVFFELPCFHLINITPQNVLFPMSHEYDKKSIIRWSISNSECEKQSIPVALSTCQCCQLGSFRMREILFF